MKYKNPSELKILTNRDLVHYKRKLAEDIKRIKQEAEVWSYYYNKIIDELKTRQKDLEFTSAKLQVLREDCEDDNTWAQNLEIH